MLADTKVSREFIATIFMAEDCMFLQNVGNYLQVYAVLEPRKTTSLSSSPWKTNVSQDHKMRMNSNIIFVSRIGTFCCCSCLWGETMSLNCCSSAR
jgi:hypothetical protein